MARVYGSDSNGASEVSPARTLAGLGTALVCDVLDRIGCRDSFLGPEIMPVWPSPAMAGPAFTLTCRPANDVPSEPYGVLFQALADRHEGAILVIGAGDLVSGVWGELLSTAAIARGLVGAVTDGLTRDVTGIVDVRFPMYATGTSPLDSAGRQDFAAIGEPVTIGGVTIRPNDWIVGDNLGVAVIPAEHRDRVIELGMAKMTGESTVRQELAAGEDLGTVFRRHGIL